MSASSPRRQPVGLKRTGRSGRTRRGVRLLVGVFAVAIVVDALVGEHGLMAMLRAKREYIELVEKVERKKAENAALADQVNRFSSDPPTIEEFARRNLGLMRPGETIFIINDLEKHEP